MMPRRSGFSLIEVVVAMILISIVAGMVVPAFGRMQARQQLMNSRDAFVLLAARARAEATATGGVGYLELDGAGDEAWIRVASDTLVRLSFRNDFDADVSTDGGSLEVCYTARGLTLSSCTTSGLPDTVSFVRGADTALAVVEPLGQVKAP